jgi:hypothetical protein
MQCHPHTTTTTALTDDVRILFPSYRRQQNLRYFELHVLSHLHSFLLCELERVLVTEPFRYKVLSHYSSNYSSSLHRHCPLPKTHLSFLSISLVTISDPLLLQKGLILHAHETSPHRRHFKIIVRMLRLTGLSYFLIFARLCHSEGFRVDPSTDPISLYKCMKRLHIHVNNQTARAFLPHLRLIKQNGSV